jgi:hypothetical protein
VRAFAIRVAEASRVDMRDPKVRARQLCDHRRNPPRTSRLIAEVQPRSDAPFSIADVVCDICKGLLERVPATGSNCKSRDYRRVCCPNGSTRRMWGIGSPNTQCPYRCLSPRTKGHRQRHGLAKFQTTSPLQEQPHQTSVSQGFSAQQALLGFRISLHK